MKTQRQLDIRLLVTSLFLLVLIMLLAAVAFLEGRRVGRDGFALAREIENGIGPLSWLAVVVLLLTVICASIFVVNLVIRRRHQRKAFESERLLRLVLDNLFAYVGVLKPDGTLMEVNQAPLDAAGLKREQVIGRPFPEASWWTHAPEVQARVWRSIAEAAAGRTERYDVEIAVAGGRRMIVDFGCGPLRDDEGNVNLLVATAVDITARKELEQQFLRAQRMEVIGMLAGGLAHDLNNILAPMLMAASLLKTRLNSASDQKMLAMIEGGAHRGADIIRQLLIFSRGEVVARGPVQLRHLMREMGNIMKETFPRSIELWSFAPSGLWPVEGDATQLHQVLLNLCVNARDAMPRGGKLALNAENLTVDETNHHRHPQAPLGAQVLLTITDTGEGIVRENLHRIFDPFFTTKPVGKGTGLGLSSVLGIVKNHGGTLTVESEPGRGTTFRIYLPKSAHAGPHKPVATDQLSHGKGEMILLVDDEVAMRDATREMLELHNYRVLVAGQGEEALALFVRHRADIRLILTDVEMPVMNGVELIRSIRVLNPEMKAVVMSGSDQAGKQDELAELGITEMLKKPCEPGMLLARMHAELKPPG